MSLRRLRAVTWNVGQIYSPRGRNRLHDGDLSQVARTLYEFDSDVILLQELVDGTQLASIADELGDYEGHVVSRCRYDRHVAVLVRRGLSPGFEEFVLDETGRGTLAATFAIGALRVCAFSVHFDVFMSRRRRAQAQSLVRLADSRAEELLIVGGDFNFDPAWAPRLGSTDDMASYALLGSRFVDAGKEAGPTLLGLVRVDSLYVRGKQPDELVARVSPRRRLPLGDHDPIICDIDLVRAVPEVDVPGRTS